MKILFSEEAWEDYQYWMGAEKKTLKRINLLIRDACRDPYGGIGKPEPLRHLLTGYWSRRINEEHRMVYRAEGKTLQIVQLRYHYSD